MILKEILHPQSSQNEILRYLSLNFATLSFSMIRFVVNFTASLLLR